MPCVGCGDRLFGLPRVRSRKSAHKVAGSELAAGGVAVRERVERFAAPGGAGMKATLVVSTEELVLDQLRLDGERYRHMFRVRRLAPDTELRLTDGRGGERSARVTEVGSSTATLVATGDVCRLTPPPWSGLVVPLLKPRRTSWMVEKATELGAVDIRFYNGPRSPRCTTTAGLERLQRVAASALSQCHGAWLPTLRATRTLEDVLGDLPTEPARLVCTRGAPAPNGDQAGAVWAVGPEGGFSERERRLLERAGFAPVGFGANVLRTETAAVAALVCGSLR